MNNTPAPTTDPKPAPRYLKATLAGGAGGLLALLFFLLEHRPELAKILLERVLIAWGPQFVILLLLFVFLYLLADRYPPRLISAQRETAVALHSLARAVEQLVARDNSFQREQDVLLNHVARRVEALHKLMENHHRALNGHVAKLRSEVEPSEDPVVDPVADPGRSRRERTRDEVGAKSKGAPRRNRPRPAPVRPRSTTPPR